MQKNALPHSELRTKWFSLIEKGYLSELESLVRQHPQIVVEWVKRNNQTALLIAAEKGHASVVKWLIEEKKANVGVSDIHGNTLLHAAARCDSIPTLKLCLAQVANGSLDIDAMNRQMQTPLINELQARASTERVQAILDAGANASYPFNSPIDIACGRDVDHLLPLLVKHGASISHNRNPDRNDDWRWSYPLHSAAAVAGHKAVRWLLSAGADPNELDDGGNNPLARVASCRTSPHTVQVAQLLLDAGTDPLHKNRSGERAADIVQEAADPKMHALIHQYTQHALLALETPTLSLSPPKHRL